jgi:hypothetical protein
VVGPLLGGDAEGREVQLTAGDTGPCGLDTGLRPATRGGVQAVLRGPRSALQAPQQFAAFREHAVAYWMSALVDAQGPDTDPATRNTHGHACDRHHPRTAARPAHQRDRGRVQDAAEGFLATLERKA